MVTSNCKWCDKEITRGGNKQGVFCSLSCKGEWQMTQKPVDFFWLCERYLDDQLSTYQIAELVCRNPKQVCNWLKGYGIPTRERSWDIIPNQYPYQTKEYLEQEYINKKRSASDIADEFGVTANNILFFIHRFGIKTRSVSETRAIKHWGLYGIENGMYGRTGPESPNWKGGFTPERQAFYNTPEWIEVAKLVRKREDYSCKRCGVKKTNKPHHIHHIISFSVERLRSDPDNLVLLCYYCHKFVHSKKNTDKEYLGVV